MIAVDKNEPSSCRVGNDSYRNEFRVSEVINVAIWISKIPQFRPSMSKFYKGWCMKRRGTRENRACCTIPIDCPNVDITRYLTCSRGMSSCYTPQLKNGNWSFPGLSESNLCICGTRVFSAKVEISGRGFPKQDIFSHRHSLLPTTLPRPNAPFT